MSFRGLRLWFVKPKSFGARVVWRRAKTFTRLHVRSGGVAVSASHHKRVVSAVTGNLLISARSCMYTTAYSRNAIAQRILLSAGFLPCLDIGNACFGVKRCKHACLSPVCPNDLVAKAQILRLPCTKHSRSPPRSASKHRKDDNACAAADLRVAAAATRGQIRHLELVDKR